MRRYATVLLRQPPWNGRGVASPAGRYGPGEGPALPLVLLGDSLAVSVGVSAEQDTVGAFVAETLAERLGCGVELKVMARAGATTAALDRQVRRVLDRETPGVAVVLIGGNDVVRPVALRRSAARLERHVREMRDAGWEVLVGLCPDVGMAPALRPGVARLMSRRSRRLARLQAAAVLEAGGRAFVMATNAFRERPDRLFCADGFHPSPEGYRVCFGRMAPALAGAGEEWLFRQSLAAAPAGVPAGAVAGGSDPVAAGQAAVADEAVPVRPRARGPVRATRLTGRARTTAGVRERV